MNARMTDVEVKLTFQEHIIQELNDVIAGQQIQLDQVKEELRLLHQALQSIKSSNDLPFQEQEAPPPHY